MKRLLTLMAVLAMGYSLMAETTNIQATVSVSIVTNVTEKVTAWERMEPTSCPDGLMGCLVFHSRPAGEPTAKAITTEVSEITTLSFEWLGVKRVIESKKILSSKTVNLRRQETWIESNEPLPPPAITWGELTIPLKGSLLLQ